MSERIPLGQLAGSKAAPLICWPRCTEEVLAKRIDELKGIGVVNIVLSGRHRVEQTPVQGKGHTGLVVEAETQEGSLALKARRIDADRPSMGEEARLLSAANRVGIGPKLVRWSTNFLLMELVRGPYLGEWIRELTPSDAEVLTIVLRRLLDQARRLDNAGIDHGELVRVKHHIILSHGEPVIIDFESASTLRRPTNVTTVVQSLFLNTRTSESIEMVSPLPSREPLLEKLRLYKSKMDDESYLALIKVAGLD